MGERLVNFCLNNNCAIGGTIFQHKYSHKLTWKSPDGKTVNQIGHVVINNKWRRPLKDVHTCRGTDTGSDHYLVMSRLKLFLRKATTKKNRPRKYNIPRFRQDEVLKAFVVEMKNQFQLLSTEETDHPQVEGKWNQIKDVYCNTAKNTLGYLKITDKTWLSTDTWRNQVKNSQHLCRHTQASVSIANDKEGNPLTTEETEAKRWVEHFRRSEQRINYHIC